MIGGLNNFNHGVNPVISHIVGKVRGSFKCIKQAAVPIIFLVLTFSVVGSATANGGGDKQIVEPVGMIDPTIELMSGRDVVLTDLRPRAIRPEIMKQGPGSYL